ncbi:MAG TPA: radical SAM family heme chaperone HemW [Bacteroides mediterraneensis]|uniref:radical SAM family heme chaperone HemW n=1 Tax=Bacteroides mediterraneensis TaxID=1841856 RepID=UPI002639B8C7|nr:radical SAM family heme chaperone HemW [Bacteroides mediterraneensis]HJH65571.1 radical SAM family heme chaperone HemW [Bacteroides mediterraneensis]
MAGIYLHIPFCKRRCIYCDFFSTTENEKKEAYIQALVKELELRKDYLSEETIDTIYLGGGTPSQLEEKDFAQLFDHIYKVYPVNPAAEITLEANPDDLTPAYVNMLRGLPFNRLSMGIQTFKEDTLRLLHRRHTATQARQAYQRCREAGFHNISIDLMYGLPGETLEDWQKDLQTAISMHPEHISAYHLIYEEGTPLWKLKEAHKVEETDEDLSVSLFKELIHTLKAYGYEHYEISNFCQPGYYSRHNSSYWTGKKYLGCGPSAHSYDGISRQWNIASLSRYIQGIQQGTPYLEKEELDLYTRYNDFVITRLRTSSGIPTAVLKETFGDMLYNYCMRMASPHLQQALLTCDNHILKLTEKGIFISDGIMSDLLWVEG